MYIWVYTLSWDKLERKRNIIPRRSSSSLDRVNPWCADAPDAVVTGEALLHPALILVPQKTGYKDHTPTCSGTRSSTLSATSTSFSSDKTILLKPQGVHCVAFSISLGFGRAW